MHLIRINLLAFLVFESFYRENRTERSTFQYKNSEISRLSSFIYTKNREYSDSEKHL